MHLPKSKLLKTAPLKRALTAEANAVSAFKAALKNAHKQLEAHQHQGISAAQLVEKYTWVVDQLVTLAWRHFSVASEHESVTLVAVGGYGRKELHPYSDVDLLVLLEKDDYLQLQPVVEPFLRFLWGRGV